MNEGKKERASGVYNRVYTVLREPTNSRNPKAIHEKENIPEIK